MISAFKTSSIPGFGNTNIKSTETKTFPPETLMNKTENDQFLKELSIKTGLQQWFPKSWMSASLSTPLYRFLAHPVKIGGIHASVAGLGVFLLSKTSVGDELMRSFQSRRNVSVSNNTRIAISGALAAVVGLLKAMEQDKLNGDMTHWIQRLHPEATKGDLEAHAQYQAQQNLKREEQKAKRESEKWVILQRQLATNPDSVNTQMVV